MIDDALFVKIAAQIARDPSHPFGMTLNWYGWDEPLWGVFKNPPGVSYWLAAVEKLGGAGEIAWHLSLLPFTVAAVIAGVRLARRFTIAPGWTTAAWVASPAFLISASTLMADVPSLALTSWGLVFWIDGVDRGAGRRRRLGALLTGVAVVVKYTSVLAIGALVFYAITRAPVGHRAHVDRGAPNAARRRRALSDALDAWPALMPAAAWALMTLVTDGRIHLIDSLLVRGGGLDPNPGWLAHRAVALLTFVAGAGVFPMVFAAADIVPRRRRAAAILAGVIGVAAAVAAPFIWSPRGLLPGAVPLVGILAAFGACALLATARVAWKADPDAIFLAATIALHVVFLLFWSWTIAARFVLPLLLPLALLVGRIVSARPALTRTLLLGGATVAGLVLSVTLLRADRAAGDFHRRVIADIAAQATREHRAASFTGAWGFQYYAERAGMTRLDVRAPHVAASDLVLKPYFVANNELPAALTPRLTRIASFPSPAPALGLHTMNLHAGAGFYSSVYGPLPFFAAPLPADGVEVWLVREP